MQTVITLPVLQAVSDSTDHYLGLQPIIKGRTNAQFVNANLRFNPSSNTLTLDANLNLKKGSVRLDALSANGTIAGNLGVAGNFSFNSGYGFSAVAYGCRAWVNFNGTGTVAIRASGNVSSITDNGAGDYTVNFTTAMPDVNYAFSVTAGNGSNDIFSMAPYISAPTVSTLRVLTALGSRVGTDCLHVSVAIFR